MKKSDKMRKLAADLAGKKPEAKKEKKVVQTMEAYEMKADVNKDGKVDEKDVEAVKKIIKKKKKSYKKED